MRNQYGNSANERMKFEDKLGNAYEQEDIDNMASWEIDELGLHVAES